MLRLATIDFQHQERSDGKDIHLLDSVSLGSIDERPVLLFHSEGYIFCVCQRERDYRERMKVRDPQRRIPADICKFNGTLFDNGMEGDAVQ